MGGYSVWLSPPKKDKTRETINEFFEYAKQKRSNQNMEFDYFSIEDNRQFSLDCYDDGKFLIDQPVSRAYYSRIPWLDIAALIPEQERVPNENLEELISVFRKATTELENESEKQAGYYRCYAECSFIALCEFARDRGYDVEIVD